MGLRILNFNFWNVGDVDGFYYWFFFKVIFVIIVICGGWFLCFVRYDCFFLELIFDIFKFVKLLIVD